MNSVSAPIYTDFQGMAELKARAHADAKGSLDKVARQLESLFTQMMLKSMRQAKLGDGLMDNDQTKFYQEMYDQQLALHLSESGGIGLTEVIKSQLGGSDAANDSQPVNSFSEYRNSVIGLMDRRSGPPISLQDGKPIIAPPSVSRPVEGSTVEDPTGDHDETRIVDEDRDDAGHEDAQGSARRRRQRTDPPIDGPVARAVL
ncbi:MAG: rod-binding protein [Gammaproteobacteria bacterium]